MTANSPLIDGPSAEVTAPVSRYRGPLPHRDVRTAKVLLCKVLDIFGSMSQVQIAQVLNLPAQTVGDYVRVDLDAVIPPGRGDEAPAFELNDVDVAELAGKLTSQEAADLRAEYAPGVKHDGRDIGAMPLVRTWLDSLTGGQINGS
jgi:hypothetical protein